MNNDVPETLAAARSRAADLEQQLKLSDEGVSRLAQRCLELEQQVLNYQAALARHGSDNEPAALTLPQLFYDSGSGYSPRECLTVAEDAYDELTHEVSAVFTLPTDARALRLDPGELACCVTDLSISDERLECRAMNGIQLQEDCLLFLDVDPNLTVCSTVPFAAGMKFAVTYHYYPLGRFQHEQPGKALLSALNTIKLQAEAEKNDVLEQLQALDDTGRHIRIIGKKDLTDRNAVVSIQTPEIDMSQVAWQLDNEYGVMTRVGLHCAPNAHKTLGTYPAGTIRFSFGPENTKNELDFAIQGLKKILDL